MDYHKVRESFACDFSIAGHIDRTENPSDILTKPFSPSEFNKHNGPVIFRIISKVFKFSPQGELQN